MSTKRRLSTDEEQGSSNRQKPSARDEQDSSTQLNSPIPDVVSVGDYHVGWICALPLELAAAKGMLDERHGEFGGKEILDHNTYTLGRIHKHNVVIACCPAGVYGTVSAAAVARDMMRTFPSIRVGLMVGIGGAAPSAEHDIRLGDVVVSQPSETFGGVIQFDRGKTVQNGDFKRTGALSLPPTELLTALALLQSEHEASSSKVPDYISKMVERYPGMKKEYTFQEAAEDCLYEAGYDHPSPHVKTCKECDPQHLVIRDRRENNLPKFHYGNIASSNQVLKHGGTREKLRRELDVLCFEMEAAGLMSDFPCIVIRGMSDYSDSHKETLKVWQKYAAATAAAFAKEFLSFVSTIRKVPGKESFGVIFDPTGIPQTNDFTGRESELALIKGQLRPGEYLNRRKVCVLHGLGGIGKTHLAIEYMILYRASYTSCFWLDGKTEVSLIQSLLRLASQLPKHQIVGVDVQKIQGLEESRKRAKEVLQWFTLKGNTQWLLIYDNIDKTSYKDELIHKDQDVSSTYNIRDYFPRNMAGSIIITTRLQRLTSLGAGIHLCKLKTIDSLWVLEKHAGRSLKQISGHISSATNDEINNWHQDAISLVNRLDHLPLALVFAGSYLRKVSLAKYLELYDKSWLQLHKTIESQYERTIITTWEISFHEVACRDIGAAKLLRLWGYLDNQEIWYQFLHWGPEEVNAPDWLRKITATEISFIETISILLEYSLIERNNNTESFSMHAVVHDWIREFVNKNNDKDLLQVATTTISLAIPDYDTREYSVVQRRILPHVNRWFKYWSQISKTQNIMDQEINLCSIDKIGSLFRDQGKLAEAKQIYQRALQGKEKALGPDHISTLDTVNSLGILYNDQGKFAEAEQMYQRALQGEEKALGPDHILTLDIVNNLGVLYNDQGKPAEAEQMYQRALYGKEKALGLDHISTLGIVYNLGNLYLNQGKLVEAEQMYQRALQGYEKALGPDHISTLDIVNSLGVLYNDQGKPAEAEQMYQRALYGKEKALGLDHISTLGIVYNLGNLYLNQGKLVEAEQMYQRALQGEEKALRPDHIFTLSIVNNLGILYNGQGKLAEAEQMYQRALQGNEKALGPDHISTLDTVNNLGILHNDQGKLAEAEQMYQRALQGKEKALGPDHISTLDTVNNLGILHNDQGKLAEAEQMYQRALQGKEKALGPDHISTLDIVNNLGVLYNNQGKPAEAEQMYQRALEGYEKALGFDNPKCETVRENLISLARLNQKKKSSKLRKMMAKLSITGSTKGNNSQSKC